ncbi:hypothetical protein [Streptomyces sp. NPDC047939]|uniref:hypothetical protein n=1 Tax=Streptomyces sp. NPDC047939 TaxID=3155381 RepID=UPI0034163A16
MTTVPATAPASHAVTAEDAAKASKSVADLDRIERVLTTVLVILGVGGLFFTAFNVTTFALDHDVHWAIAWMLDPLVTVALLAALFIDGKLSAHGYKPSGWPFVLRWFAGLTTWLMNCWGSLYPDAKFTGMSLNPDFAGLLLHSAIPFLVIVLAEAGAGWRRFCSRKKPEYVATITAWKDQEEARRAAERKAKEDRVKAERAAQEAERKRAAELADTEKRAAVEAQKAREVADAEARRIRAEEEVEARRAERTRQEAEARLRQEAEAREQQARINRQNAAHAAELERQRIATEAQAEAERIRAQAEVDAAEKAREDRRRAAEARRAQTAIPDEQAPAGTAIPAAIPSAKATAIPSNRTAEADEVRGAEAKRKQIEEATFEAAVLIFSETAPTRRDFAARYGRGETWGRDRYAEAERLMDEDADYAAQVLAEAEKRTTTSHA